MMRTGQRRWRLVVVAGVVVLTLTALWVTRSRGPDAEARLLGALPDGVETTRVSLAETFGDLGWETFTVACPYEVADDLADELGVAARSLRALPGSDDGSQAVLLVEDRRVVRQWKFGRGAIDFCGSGSPSGRLRAARTDSLTFVRAVDDERWVLSGQ